MSDGIKAMHDDIDEWERFKHKAKIASVAWDMYSIEADFAKEGFNTYALTNSRLVDYVNARVDIRNILNEQKKHDDEYLEYLRLKEKFERA